MKIIIDMSIGMICTIVALIIIVIVAIWSCRNREKLTNHPIIAAIAIISLVLSVITVVFLYFSNYHIGDLSFNYSDASIAALSVLATILLGWNIWSVIDSKRFEDNVKKELNYTHNKIDYDLGVMYISFSQMLAAYLVKLEKSETKKIMINYMINGLKILSKMPNTSIECNSVTNTIAETLSQTTDISITSESAREIIERLGEIENRASIEGIDVIRTEISKFI